ncbi:hypothetical protein STTU_6358 [Streptomyces sp. Tu6071]|nr:hypothetical protein STTU_6358 [Streptomyces sp. Tu6071]
MGHKDIDASSETTLPPGSPSCQRPRRPPSPEGTAGPHFFVPAAYRRPVQPAAHRRAVPSAPRTAEPYGPPRTSAAHRPRPAASWGRPEQPFV